MTDTVGRLYRVRVIQAGLSGNGNFYPDAVLREAALRFDGARVFVKGDKEHLAGGGKDVRNLIGRIVNPVFVPGAGPDRGEIRADLELIDPGSEIGRKLIQAQQRGMSDLFGLSIDAEGAATRGTKAGKPAQITTALTKVRSVDLIVEPGAGGRVLDLLEAASTSKGQTVMDREQLISHLQQWCPPLLAGRDPDTLTDEELSDLAGKAMKAGGMFLASQDTGGGKTKPQSGGAMPMREAMRRIDATKLPGRSKDRLIQEFEVLGTFTEAQVHERIKQEIADLAPFAAGGRVTGLGDAALVELVEGRDEKVRNMLDAFFDPTDRSVVSIRECYREITGDRDFTGRVRNCDQARLREALGTESFADVLGDSIARRMVKEYNAADAMDVWRDMVDIVPVADFRTQERTRFGGYGDLPKVAERDPYVELTSPTDEKATYAVEKRGGTESVTLEMITNDDVGAMKRIPLKMAQAAKRTLSRFVLDIPRTNPVIFDGVALFHADHGNLGTAALSSAAVAAGRIAIRHQKEKDSDEPLGIGPAFLWVPDALEEAAFNLFRRSVNNDTDFVQSLQLQVRPVWCWTDTSDWMLSADVRKIPFIELGFLHGKEEPELFIQDSPTSGSLFANDTVTYKIRHIYGATPVDWRGAYKAVVA